MPTTATHQTSQLTFSKKGFIVSIEKENLREKLTDKRGSQIMLESFFPQAIRYFHTLRYLKSTQTIGRLWAMAKIRVGFFLPIPESPKILTRELDPATAFLKHDPWNRRENILKGEFCFLHQTASLGMAIDWHPQQMPLLWQFNLHYFQFLHLLTPEEQTAICQGWIAANPRRKSPGWHPFPTALRIIHWCKVGVQNTEVLRSLYQQAAFLFRNLETYHPGNHLLENARALIFAGCYFQGQGEAERWLAQGLKIYFEETPRQILKDGGHFERSPMYHAHMLEGYLDILNILPEDLKNREILMDAAQRMSDFLVSVTHPDGNLALFNDSTRELAVSSQDLLDYAKSLLGHSAQKQTDLPHSGYFIHETNALYCIIDGGAIGPDFLPAHAHADIFSYELSLRGVPLVVDSGVFEYSTGSFRDYVRSTRAHNTVCVDQTDQVECWRSFRVARRFRPDAVSFEKDGNSVRFEGLFNGYAKLLGDDILHRRTINFSGEQQTILIDDLITGTGTHITESLIHLHPEVTVTIKENQAHLARNQIKAVCTVNQGILSMEEGWYCPEFGIKQRNKVLIIAAQSLPATLSYTISY